MIIGHERPLQFLKKAFEHKKVPHALFFWGPREVGTLTVAAEFARGLLCDRGQFLGCEVCASCQPTSPTKLSHILSASQIKQEIEDEKQGIGIEVIREIQQRLQTNSFAGKPRVIIIEDAEALTDQSSNAMLKILEEPPADAYFIIIGVSKESVFQTILSRTVPIRFSLVPQSTLLAYITREHPHISEQESGMLARFAQGRPGRLIRGITDPSAIKDAQKKYSLVFSLFSNPLYASLQKIETITKKDESIGDYMEETFSAFRSIMFLHKSAEPPHGLKIPETTAKNFRERYTPKDCVRIFKKLFQTQSLLQDTNANARIAFESFILEL